MSLTRMNARRGLIPLEWGIAGVALLVRIALVLLTREPPETFEYETLVRNLLEGRGFTYAHLGTTYRSVSSQLPYIFLNAAICGATDHNHLVLLLAQSLLSALLTLTIFRTAAMIFDRQTGAVAALLTALHPGLIVYDTRKLHALSLDALLIALALLVCLHLKPQSSWLMRAAAGLVIGVGLLQRGSLIVFAVVAPLVLARVHRLALRATARFVFPIALCAGLMLGPLVARNYLIHHTLTLMTSSGENFWRGNNPNATGTPLTKDGMDIINVDQKFRSEIVKLDELGQMRAFSRAALAFWIESPAKAAWLFFKKLLYFFTVTPTTGLLYPSWEFRVYMVYYVVIALGALTGLFVLVAKRHAGNLPQPLRLLPLWCIVTVGVVQSAVYVETRHRWGVEPIILILTAAGIVSVYRAKWANTLSRALKTSP